MHSSIKSYCLFALTFAAASASAAALPTAEVTVVTAGDVVAVDGVVEAVRQSDIAAQVPGRVTALLVKAGDTVKAGQTLVRIDERVARQQALAGRSQVTALAAQLDAATKDYQRQQTLYKQGFLSQAALERAESQFKATQAQTRAQMAEAESAVVQTGLHVLVAPYDGVVAKTDVQMGDMALPGKVLMTLYDPSALRVVVNVPQTRIAGLRRQAVKVEIPAARSTLELHEMIVLPTADPVSQIVQIRLPLPVRRMDETDRTRGRATPGLARLEGDFPATAIEPGARVVPGMFSRAYLPVAAQGGTVRARVPTQAVFRRSELTAVYVVGKDGRPQLRLVRTGHVDADQTEIVAGLEAGERVVLDPLAVTPR